MHTQFPAVLETRPRHDQDQCVETTLHDTLTIKCGTVQNVSNNYSILKSSLFSVFS